MSRLAQGFRRFSLELLVSWWNTKRSISQAVLAQVGLVGMVVLTMCKALIQKFQAFSEKVNATKVK